MIINSISMKNFQCYYGDHENNTLKFGKGLNLVIGDNGAGKSKLFDAFYWVFYDRIFDSGIREFVPTSTYRDKLISDRAKKETNKGATVNVEVIACVISATDREYRVSRIITAKKIDENEFECLGSSRLLIDEKKQYQWTSVPSVNHEAILGRVIPEHLKPYMWFQGEQVDSLLDFRDRTTLENAINLLSNVTLYDEITEIAKKGYAKAEQSYRSAQRKLTNDASKSEALENSMRELEKEIEEKKDLINSYAENLEVAKDMIEELISQIDDANQKSELQNEKKRIDNEMRQYESRLTEKYLGLHKQMFTKYWVLNSAKSNFEKYSKKYKDFFDKHSYAINVAKLENVKLPINIPQPVHLHQMLEDERCFVCNQDAKEGTPAFRHIKSLLEREESIDVFENDCSSYFESLYNNGLSFDKLIAGIPVSITNEFNDINNLQEKIDEYKKRINVIKSNFSELMDNDRSHDIVASFKTHEKNRERYQDLLINEQKKLEELDKKLNQCNKDIANLVSGDIDKEVEIGYSIFKDLVTLSQHVRVEVFDNLIHELEESANTLFSQMTETNTSITGQIKLKKLSNGNYIPEIVGSDGFVLTGMNDSNIILVKLSLIMAIIISRGSSSVNYALILDAPTSKMSENYTKGFYETLGNNFTQSIVVTYDFLDEDVSRYASNFNLSRVYKLTSDNMGDDRADRTSLSVKLCEIIL